MVDPWLGDGEDCLRKDVAKSDVGEGDMRVASKDRERAHAYDQLIPPGAPCVPSYCLRALILLSLHEHHSIHHRTHAHVQKDYHTKCAEDNYFCGPKMRCAEHVSRVRVLMNLLLNACTCVRGVRLLCVCASLYDIT